ncbi:host attachment protein [Devosia algicola]|uniref:Host attachment protein n=1 Tax=Devosia algicola TaxID=3026418 RepID=A0ABY7YS66_9HYPH|nr:host attachment protein [Devosia algicola]WDR03849.1 host attachment protein [Devosia algicola]
MKKTITWILLADGAQARVLEHTGPGKGLKQVDGLDFAIPTLQAQDIMADRPGRGAIPGGDSKSGMQPRTDPVQHREAEFVKSMAAMLDEKLRDSAYDRLVISASPIALGVIRKAMTPAVKNAIVGELDKDLTNTPTAQLAKHFDGILAV